MTSNILENMKLGKLHIPMEFKNLKVLSSLRSDLLQKAQGLQTQQHLAITQSVAGTRKLRSVS